MKRFVAFMAIVMLPVLSIAQGDKITLKVGDPAPPFVIAKWAKGAPIAKLGDGRMAVVEFSATWCLPCKESIPHLTALAKKYAGKVDVISVYAFEHLPSDKACFDRVGWFVETQGSRMDYQVAVDSHDNKMGKSWSDAAGMPWIPTSFVVGKDGKIFWIGHPSNLDFVLDGFIHGTFNPRSEAQREKAVEARDQKDREQFAPLFAQVEAAVDAKNYRLAVRRLDKIRIPDPGFRISFATYEIWWISTYDPRAAMKYADSLTRGEYKSDPMALRQFAWEIVWEGSKVKSPDYSVAIRIAEQAVKLSKGEPVVMDLLALAYYRAKRVDDAIAAEQKAIDKAVETDGVDSKTLEGYRTQLALYMKG